MTPEQIEAERALFEQSLRGKIDVDTKYLLSLNPLCGLYQEYFHLGIQNRFEGWLAKAEQVQNQEDAK